jgi:hypothetical protein
MIRSPGRLSSASARVPCRTEAVDRALVDPGAVDDEELQAVARPPQRLGRHVRVEGLLVDDERLVAGAAGERRFVAQPCGPVRARPLVLSVKRPVRRMPTSIRGLPWRRTVAQPMTSRIQVGAVIVMP